jgi:hypothetical protein
MFFLSIVYKISVSLQKYYCRIFIEVYLEYYSTRTAVFLVLTARF